MSARVSRSPGRGILVHVVRSGLSDIYHSPSQLAKRGNIGGRKRSAFAKRPAAILPRDIVGQDLAFGLLQ